MKSSRFCHYTRLN